MGPLSGSHRPVGREGRGFVRGRWLLLAALIFLPGGLARGQTADETVEYQVKAAFLLNFAKFVEWPAGAFPTADSPIAICVLGKDPFGRALDEVVQGETVNARRLVVQRINQAPAPRMCNVLFVGGGEKDVPKLLDSLGRQVLTVGEGDKFLRDGGMIALVIDNRRVRFDVNQMAAVNAGLTLSSRLLSVARSVEK